MFFQGSEVRQMGKLTRLGTIMGDLYTTLQPHEVRQYLQKQSGGGAIYGYADSAGTIQGYVAVKNIIFIYEEQVDIA